MNFEELKEKINDNYWNKNSEKVVSDIVNELKNLLKWDFKLEIFWIYDKKGKNF